MVTIEKWSYIIDAVPMACMTAAVICVFVGLVLYYGRVRTHVHAVGVRVSSFRIGWCFPAIIIDCIRAERFYHKGGRSPPVTLRLEVFILGSFFVLFGLGIISAWGLSSLSEKCKEHEVPMEPQAGSVRTY